MPAKKIVNNLPILNKVIAHWVNLEKELKEAAVLPDGTTLDGTKDLAASLLSIETSLTQTRNTLSAAQNVRKTARDTVHTAARQARKSLRGQASNVPEVRGLPDLPVVSSAPATLLSLYTDIADVWERINGLPAASVPAVRLPLRIPLTENNALVMLDLAGFRARITAFDSATQSVLSAEAAVTVGIGERDVLHKQASALVKSYATLVRGLLPEGHPLLKTIPTLTG